MSPFRRRTEIFDAFPALLKVPNHPHAADWTANAGPGLLQKGAPQTSRVGISGLLATILDEARVCEREVRHEFKRIQEEKGQMPK